MDEALIQAEELTPGEAGKESESRSNGMAKVYLRGNLGSVEAGELNDALGELIGRGVIRIIIDMTTLKYLSSAVVGALFSGHGRVKAPGGGIAICQANADVLEVLEAISLDNVIPIFETFDEALAYLR